MDELEEVPITKHNINRSLLISLHVHMQCYLDGRDIHYLPHRCLLSKVQNKLKSRCSFARPLCYAALIRSPTLLRWAHLLAHSAKLRSFATHLLLGCAALICSPAALRLFACSLRCGHLLARSAALIRTPTPLHSFACLLCCTHSLAHSAALHSFAHPLHWVALIHSPALLRCAHSLTRSAPLCSFACLLCCTHLHGRSAALICSRVLLRSFICAFRCAHLLTRLFGCAH